MSETITESPQTGAIPENEFDAVIDPRDVYLIMYKQAGNIKTSHFHFVPSVQTNQPLRYAIQRAQKHCELMDYRFIHCAPFLVDFDALEAKRVGM